MMARLVFNRRGDSESDQGVSDSQTLSTGPTPRYGAPSLLPIGGLYRAAHHYGPWLHEHDQLGPVAVPAAHQISPQPKEGRHLL